MLHYEFKHTPSHHRVVINHGLLSIALDNVGPTTAEFLKALVDRANESIVNTEDLHVVLREVYAPYVAPYSEHCVCAFFVSDPASSVKKCKHCGKPPQPAKPIGLKYQMGL